MRPIVCRDCRSPSCQPPWANAHGPGWGPWRCESQAPGYWHHHGGRATYLMEAADGRRLYVRLCEVCSAEAPLLRAARIVRPAYPLERPVARWLRPAWAMLHASRLLGGPGRGVDNMPRLR